MNRILVIVPTRGRPQSVIRLIHAWRDTDAFDYADLLLALDIDDPRLPDYTDIGLSTRDAHVIWDTGTRMGMAPRTNLLASANAWRYFALGSAGDDHVPRTRGWAKRYVEELAEMGTGIVYGDDGLQRSNLCTEWAMTSNIVRRLNRMIPAPVQHLFADNSVMKLGEKAGIIRHLPDVHIEHMHPVARKASMDEGYARVNSRERWREDEAAYVDWYNSRMAVDVATVRTLL